MTVHSSSARCARRHWLRRYAGRLHAALRDNDEGQLAAARAPAERSPKDLPAIAVGVAATRLLYGYDLLERRVLGNSQPSCAAPIVAGGSVVTQEGDR
jgi:hypothetical protein